MSHPSTIATFIVPDWGDIIDSGIRLSYRPPAFVAWGALYTVCQSRLYPPVRDYEYVYSTNRLNEQHDCVAFLLNIMTGHY
jgi:hypothetical protein